MSRRVAILISGGGSNMVALLDGMAQDPLAEPCLVLSNNPEAGGLARAAQRGVETAVVDHRRFGVDRDAFEAALGQALDRARPDVICLAGFMRILGAQFVSQHARMLNIHPSLLPFYPGLNTHARALAAGDAEAGCTVHAVTPELDGGPVLGQARVPVAPGDTPQTLAARVLRAEHRLYPAVLSRFIRGERTPLLMG